jgi:hypothetical protein
MWIIYHPREVLPTMHCMDEVCVLPADGSAACNADYAHLEGQQRLQLRGGKCRRRRRWRRILRRRRRTRREHHEQHTAKYHARGQLQRRARGRAAARRFAWLRRPWAGVGHFTACLGSGRRTAVMRYTSARTACPPWPIFGNNSGWFIILPPPTAAGLPWAIIQASARARASSAAATVRHSAGRRRLLPCSPSLDLVPRLRPRQLARAAAATCVRVAARCCCVCAASRSPLGSISFRTRVNGLEALELGGTSCDPQPAAERIAAALLSCSCSDTQLLLLSLATSCIPAAAARQGQQGIG